MCGIAGAVAFAGRRVDETTLVAMCDAIRHRGPADRGMLALAVWDVRRERLILARDRFGKKPLLYADQPDRLRFASEFQGLMASGDLPLEIDLDALDAYLTFMSIPAPLTIYRGVRKLPP